MNVTVLLDTIEHTMQPNACIDVTPDTCTLIYTTPELIVAK
jgi:hypothetical protein